jgi:hypothetical protein
MANWRNEAKQKDRPRRLCDGPTRPAGWAEGQKARRSKAHSNGWPKYKLAAIALGGAAEKWMRYRVANREILSGLSRRRSRVQVPSLSPVAR